MPPIRRSPYLEINLNTWVAIFGFATVIFGGGVAWQNVRSIVDEHTKTIGDLVISTTSLSTRIAQAEQDVRDHAAWRAAHEDTVRDRRGEIQGAIAAAASQRAALDERLDAQEALASRMGDRMSVLDAQSRELTNTLREMQRAIADQGADLRVIRSALEGDKPGDAR